ncbi:MAG: hypothetical protein B7Z60_04260 [Ferrovum sp. 37-45-19]|uniref:outer membrane beta-barrel protein n=1 Tax=Ferrovum sp. JA12 TaxID=1356299 RepID=UPI000702B4FD|nr:outer membrane beta-barrel protein [Ferrovum sp. JA12]OYV79558.1 MAG: hypothetical protein B7Z65_05240 [Ferrovum sp. 21-44-67]OYV94648.1 MAG: hypothetical protein B7Z60_04260 [Ferrovum sp. 37-45-19]OZB34531.1 MAG: hypothetical protein B7X47_00540 [Ferrovum sp. 34-44-207]HQT81477.1 outer membrane beta-barrel protein [Ferrovaceae bacterium]KRH79446.1 hypothetical protein FERRO_05120 [Ferrovum sp. JA12]
MLFKGIFIALSAVCGLIISTIVIADSNTESSGPTLTDILKNSEIDIKGYFDTSYIASNKIPDPSIQVFNQDKNSFALHQFGLIISKTPKEGFGGLLNITAGRDAQTMSSYGASNQAIDLTQAYIQYAKSRYTLIGGKFGTLAGAEVIDSSADTNITRSILFGKIPFTNTGIRLTTALSDMTNIIFGINNGWDQVTDTNTQKTLEVGLSTAFTQDTSLIVSAYSGVENSFPNAGFAYHNPIPGLPQTTNAIASGTRNLLDAVFSTNLTKSLTFILNADYVAQENVPGVSGKASYAGVASYLNYQFNDQYRVSLRAEQLRDNSGWATDPNSGAYVGGVAPGANNVREATITFGYAPFKTTEIRVEERYDHSDLPVYSNSSNMNTFGVQGIYKF